MLYGIKEPLENDSETHGICDECFPLIVANLAQEMKERREGERV